jgi:uncharacterized protein (DUF58 family)
MEFKRTLNADIPGSVAELQAMMKEFLLKNKLYRILLRGKGLEFETFRAYAPDDDSTTIDWKASVRGNNLVVKQYRDERNLKIVFIVDVGENMVFGSAKKLKCEYAAEIVGAFSHLILSTGDKAGVVLFSDKIKEYIKPSGGDRHFHLLVDRLTTASNYGGASNLGKALDFALDYINTNVDSVVVVSDFIYYDESMKKKLQSLANKFETVALMVRDPLDVRLPEISAEFVIEDPQTGQQLLLNPKVASRVYSEISNKRTESFRQACLVGNIDLLELYTNEPFVPSLSEFLKGRIKKRGSIK